MIVEWTKRDENPLSAWEFPGAAGVKITAMITINKLTLSTLLLGGLLLGATHNQAAGPRAAVDAASFDAGQVPSTQPVRHTFKVLNSGDAPLTIMKVQPG